MMEGEDEMGSQFDQQQAQCKRVIDSCVFGKRKRRLSEIIGCWPWLISHQTSFVSNCISFDSWIVFKSTLAAIWNHKWFLSQACGPILVGQINDSHRSKMVPVCLSSSHFLSANLPHPGILYRRIRIGNLSLEQLYCLFVAFGRPQRRPNPSDNRKRGQRIPAVCQASSRIQVLDGVYEGNIYFHNDDLLLGLWHSRLLADPVDVLFRSIFHDDEATNYAHVQTQIRTNQLG